MQYIKVLWNHSLTDEPCTLFSELDDSRWETRKVEVYADGTNGYASNDESHGGTMLSVEPLPLLDTIAEDPQFIASVIERNEFDAVWQQRKQKER